MTDVPNWAWLMQSCLRSDVHIYKNEKHRGKSQRPFSDELVEKHFHLNGSVYGSYLIPAGGSMTRVGVVDIDDHKGSSRQSRVDQEAHEICQELRLWGLCPAIFRSSGGKGRHIWVWWKRPQDAQTVKQILTDCVKSTGRAVKAGSIEVFPKQGAVRADGFGNGVFLPIEKLSEEAWEASKDVAPFQLVMKEIVDTNDPEIFDDVIVAKAIEAIPPDYADTYDTWITIGAAIYHSSGGTPAGLYLWHTFSKKCDRKYDADTVNAKWLTFLTSGEGEKAGLGTIYHYAKLGGFDLKAAQMQQLEKQFGPVFAVPVKPVGVAGPSPAPAGILEPPGFIGDLKNWILANALAPRAVFALGSALSLASAIYGRSWRIGGMETMPNLFVCLVGQTGAGKQWYLEAPGRMLRAMGRGKEVQSTPASEAGLRKFLAASGGQCLLQIDEIGHLLQSMQMANSNSVMMSSGFLSLFGTDYLPEKSYADSKNILREVENVYVQILGATTPDKLWMNIKSAQLAEGMLNRFLFLDTIGDEEYKENLERNPEPPKELIQEAKIYGSRHVSPVKANLPLTSKAFSLYQEYGRAMHDKHDPIFVRAKEYATKIAGLIAIGCDAPAVARIHLQWAIDLVNWSMENTKLCFDSVSGDSIEEIQWKRIIHILRGHEGHMPRWELMRESKIHAKQFDVLVQTLIESGYIVVEAAEKRSDTIYQLRK